MQVQPPVTRAKMEGQKKKGHAVKAVIFGVVQGVGFRPFIYRLALKHGYKGWVKNIGFGVEVHLESNKAENFEKFFVELENSKPGLSRIEQIDITAADFQSCRSFDIKKSKQGESFVFISPDISVCGNCAEEMKTPADRRYHYPFINCTDCGPRYTIVCSLPYDRAKTTMDGFEMCADCRKEYENPLDRRYHAQPIACPVCGPKITLLESKKGRKQKGGVGKAVDLIRGGKILGIKGLGGFHLVCDALNLDAVNRLRKIKQRKRKPFALMAKDIQVISNYAVINPNDMELLLSPNRPIVLLPIKKTIEGIAPGLDELGFMLPYTPLHCLLLDELELIVATSSNKKDSPIMKDESEGISELCDYILTHDRPILSRADDSVMRMANNQPLFVRRARGYVPHPQRIPRGLESREHILALGAELKNTISVSKKGYVVTSQFLGDLDEYQNFRYFEETISHLTHLFQIQPVAVVSDLHPNFHTTRYAQDTGLPHYQVQHHYAHVLAVLLEHGLQPEEKVLGVAWDGYGYGQDGSAWGGEFLIANYDSFRRYAHFRNVPLPGGDTAARQPWRMALSYLIDAFGANIPQTEAFKQVSRSQIQGLTEMLRQNINSPLSSSCGRLFDAVSFLTGLAPMAVEFEAEAPMRLEAAADRTYRGKYGFLLEKKSESIEINFKNMFESLVNDLEAGHPVPIIAAKFHNTLAALIVNLAKKTREEMGIETIVLSGGVFLNKKLLEKSESLLKKNGFRILRPLIYSPNDESISVGQIAYGLRRLGQKEISNK